MIHSLVWLSILTVLSGIAGFGGYPLSAAGIAKPIIVICLGVAIAAAFLDPPRGRRE